MQQISNQEQYHLLTMPIAIQQIRSELKANASEAVYASHKKLVPGINKAYGVAMPVLNKLAQEHKSAGFELVEELGKGDYVEEKILAAKLLGKIAKKNPEKSLQLFKHLSKHIDNWALCDALGMQALKPIVKTHDTEIFDLAGQFNKSGNLWLRRLSLVMVEWYTRDKKYHSEIRKLMNHLKEDREYYVKKAVAWLERNMNKGK